MSYAFELDEPVDDGLRRLVTEQIDKALAAIDEEGPHEAIHESRKRCKKVRAAARVVRKAFDGYAEANAHFRDTARLVSDLRDATAVIETVDTLVERREDALDEAAVQALREALEERRAGLSREQNLRDRLGAVRLRLVQGRRACADWRLKADGFEALVGGVRKTYRRARSRAEEALDTEASGVFHEWRKRVKYHRYQVKMLRRVFPEILEAREEACHDLTDALGDDHDLVVLAGVLAEMDLEPAARDAAAAIEGLGRRRRGALRDESRRLGRRLFLAEDEERFTDRLDSWWHASR